MQVFPAKLVNKKLYSLQVLHHSKIHKHQPLPLFAVFLFYDITLLVKKRLGGDTDIGVYFGHAQGPRFFLQNAQKSSGNALMLVFVVYKNVIQVSFFGEGNKAQQFFILTFGYPKIKAFDFTLPVLLIQRGFGPGLNVFSRVIFGIDVVDGGKKTGG